MKRELSRKAIHVASVAFPLLVWWLPRTAALALLVPGALLAVAVDAARLRYRRPRYLFLRRTRTLLRPRERYGVTGGTYLMVAYALALLLFPKPVAVLAMLYAAVGDAAAAVVGRHYGRRRLRSGKSWEGAGAGFAVNLLAGVLIPGITLFAAFVGAAVAAGVELADLPPDDNVWLTLCGGAAVWAVLTFA